MKQTWETVMFAQGQSVFACPLPGAPLLRGIYILGAGVNAERSLWFTGDNARWLTQLPLPPLRSSRGSQCRPGLLLTSPPRPFSRRPQKRLLSFGALPSSL